VLKGRKGHVSSYRFFIGLINELSDNKEDECSQESS
jgi:hypothetical protein